MSIPLDRLYFFIENISKQIHGDSVVIYRFYPFGFKNIDNLSQLGSEPLTWKDHKLRPQIFCNDQEPLNFEFYENIPQDTLDKINSSYICQQIRQHGFTIPRKNMRLNAMTIWDHALLLHSEQRSIEVDKYLACDFLPVYYWSHAIIARDWFRFAQHVDLNKINHKIFLIYSRGWTGTREYRLKFLEMLCNKNLQNFCRVSMQPVDHDTGLHYSQHNYETMNWKPDIILENYLDTQAYIPPDYSADFDTSDYENTQIEVVLETLFDDDRLHFTEKILRPIAVGQPFILAGSFGGLEYLKQYGFKTFDSVWSEDYDKIKNPKDRLLAITDLMSTISQWTTQEKNYHMKKLNEIVQYNKHHFFSKEFFDHLVNELETNLQLAFTAMKTNNTCREYFELRQRMFDNQELWNKFLEIRSQNDADEVHERVLSYYLKQQNHLWM